MSHIKKLTAPASIAFLLIVAVLAPLIIPPGNSVSVPPILDPSFGLWMDSSGRRQLVVWHAEYTIAPDDFIAINQTTAGEMSALVFNLHRENANGSTYLLLSQSVEGPRLGALFSLNISTWVFRKSCECNPTSIMNHGEVFGIEINDGTHVLTFVFSDSGNPSQVLWDRRTVFINTPANQWVNIPLDISREYDSAKWKMPDRVTFGVVFGAGSGISGFRQEFLHNITWKLPSHSEYKSSFAYAAGQSSHQVWNRVSMQTQEGFIRDSINQRVNWLAHNNFQHRLLTWVMHHRSDYLRASSTRWISTSF